MEPRVGALRLSFLWFEAFADLLLDEPPAGAPMACMGRDWLYEAELDRARRGESPWTLPWPPERTGINHFWRYFLNRKVPQQLSGKAAWRHLVPLRRAIRVAPPAAGPADAGPPPGKARGEVFAYPHGAGLVLTATLEGEAPLADAVARAIEVKRGFEYQAYGAGHGGGRALIEEVRESMLGAGAEPGGASDLFSVATVIRGSGVDPGERVAAGREPHLALEGLCSWSLDWRQVTPHVLAERRLELSSKAAKGHLLYGLARGRAVWFPAAFASARAKKRTLGCYHRNLTLVSLQTESLLQLARLAGDYLERGRSMPVALESVAQSGADVLGRLYGGARSSYRSSSPPAQIDDSALVPVVNRVRDHFGLPPLRR